MLTPRRPAVNDKKKRQRIYYYIQPSDDKTNNLIRTAIPENPTIRGSGEGVGSLFPSSFYLYRTEWRDIEFFMQIPYASFNVFSRKSDEMRPRFAMRKDIAAEKRNQSQRKSNRIKLELVKNTEPADKKTKLKKCFVGNEEKDKSPPKKQWMAYVILPEDRVSADITILHIRRALSDSGMNTQSLAEADLFGKFDNADFERLWEMNGDALFRLWRYARANPLIRFAAYRTTKDGIFSNFKLMFYQPKEAASEQKATILPYEKRT